MSVSDTEPVWRPVADDPWPALAVGLLNVPNHHSLCTGWHAGGGVIVTAAHCAPTEEEARGATLSFGVLSGARSIDVNPVSCKWHQGQPPSDVDLALLDCQIPADTPCLKLHPPQSAPTAGDRIYVIHQTCDHARLGRNCIPTKKLSEGVFTEWVNTVFLAHSASTDSDSSGAPVLLQELRDQEPGYPVEAVNVRGTDSGANWAIDVEPLRPLLSECVPPSSPMP